MNGKSSRPLLQSAEKNPGIELQPRADDREIARDMDVMVPMRDGVKICVDVYRPDAPGKFPALLAFAIYNKDFQGPDMARRCRRSRPGRRYGPARWRPATRASSSRAAMSM